MAAKLPEAPQHATSPLRMRAQVNNPAVETSTASATEEAMAGVSESKEKSSSLFLAAGFSDPQHTTWPSARVAHAWYPETEIDVALSRSRTGAASPRLAHEPSPSCPLRFLPQQLTAPPRRSAQTYSPVDATRTASVSPSTTVKSP